METKLKRLPDAELNVMLKLWDTKGEVSRSYLDEALCDFGWSINTINTYLTRLAAKGFVELRREGKLNLYRPIVSKEDYLTFESRAFLGKLYSNSVSGFVTSLSRGNGIDKKQLDELQTLLDTLKGGNENASNADDTLF